ncbi:hypothetical protein HZB00_01060 [Candidatus Woesearchaeota archaeon]|nr:hypothetical protein [Candidatus Woesearchaeota archaeon]
MWYKQGISYIEEILSQVVLVIFLVVALAGAITRIADNSHHEQEVMAREVSLLHDTALASQNRVELQYTLLPDIRANLQEPCKIQMQHAKQNFPSTIPCAKQEQTKLEIKIKETTIALCSTQEKKVCSE